jgi:VanZ family protein
MIRLIIWCKPYAKYFLAIWMLTIISVSSIPSIPTLKIRVADSVFRLDYLIHFCEYGFLAFMAFLTFADKDFQIRYRKLIVLTTGLILFAVLDEFHQKFIPGRSFNLRDILSNVTGILFTLAFTIFIFGRIRAKVRNIEEIR